MEYRPVTQKRILLIIGGGIAAYKCLELIRRLRERGHRVRVVMTKAAQQFVTPLSAGALSNERVFTDLFDLDDEFARRRNHQRACPAPLPICHGGRQLCQNRQNKGRGLSCPRLGNTDNIVSGQDERNGGKLNRGWFGVTGFLDSSENLRGEIEGAKRHWNRNYRPLTGILHAIFWKSLAS